MGQQRQGHARTQENEVHDELSWDLSRIADPIRCDGSHEHQRLLEGRTKHTQNTSRRALKVDRLSSVQDENNKGDHIVEDKAPGGGWAMDDLTD